MYGNDLTFEYRQASGKSSERYGKRSRLLLLMAELTRIAAGAMVLSPMRPFFDEIGLFGE